jgi:hypothetical protein
MRVVNIRRQRLGLRPPMARGTILTTFATVIVHIATRRIFRAQVSAATQPSVIAVAAGQAHFVGTEERRLGRSLT